MVNTVHRDGLRTRRGARGPQLRRMWEAVHSSSIPSRDSAPEPLRKRARTSDAGAIRQPSSSVHPTQDTRTDEGPSRFMCVRVFGLFHIGSDRLADTSTANQGQTTGRLILTIANAETERILHWESQEQSLDISAKRAGLYDIRPRSNPQAFFVDGRSMMTYYHDTQQFELARSMRIRIEWEATDNAKWPPIPVDDFGTFEQPLVDQLVIFRSNTTSVYGRHQIPVSIIPQPSSKCSIAIPYTTDVDITWATKEDALQRAPLESEHFVPHETPPIALTPTSLEHTQEPVTARSPDDEPEEHVAMDIDEEEVEEEGEAAGEEAAEEEEHDEEVSSRPVRLRKSMNYNLKRLSSRASGRKVSDRVDSPPVNSPAAGSEPGRVQYVLPESELSVWRDRWGCVNCHSHHASLPQLKRHLDRQHGGRVYNWRRDTGSVRCEVTRSTASANDKGFRLAKLRPISPDASADEVRRRLTDRLLDDEDVPINDGPENGNLNPKSRSRWVPIEHDYKVPLIPDTTLYDPISKQPLVAGQKLPIYEQDMSWIMQRRRAGLCSFTDVSPAEQEYCLKWDSFIIPLDITSTRHLTKAWVKFVRLNADWIIAAEHRRTEHTKHMALLLARSALNDKATQLGVQYLREAQTRAKDRERNNEASGAEKVVWPPLSPTLEHIRAGRSGCAVCKETVITGLQLYCANKVNCPWRLYHTTCISSQASMSVWGRKWWCNTCIRNRAHL